MTTTIEPMALTVQMKPFYHNGEKQSYVGFGVFFDGVEFVALREGKGVFYYVADGIIDQFNKQFNNFQEANMNDVVNYCDKICDEGIRTYRHCFEGDFYPRAEGSPMPRFTYNLEFGV